MAKKPRKAPSPNGNGQTATQRRARAAGSNRFRGDTLFIRGQNFSEDAQAYFGGNPVSTTWNSPEELEVIAPDESTPCEVQVTVDNGDGSQIAVSPVNYRYLPLPTPPDPIIEALDDDWEYVVP